MAFTQQPGRNGWYEDQLLTRAAPTTSTADGVPLDTLDALTLIVQADSGATLSGGGTLDAYVYDSYPAIWVRCPELDVTSISSAVRQASYNFLVAGSKPGSRVMWKCTSVTASAGTTARVYILGGREKGL